MYSIIAIIVLVFFSAYFSATETAFTSLNRIRMKNMANDGNQKAREVMEFSNFLIIISHYCFPQFLWETIL